MKKLIYGLAAGIVVTVSVVAVIFWPITIFIILSFFETMTGSTCGGVC